jgi:hypothetical protein
MTVDPQDYARLSDNQLKFLNKYKLNDDQLAIAFAVDKEARRQKVNPDFVWPMVYQESKFDPNAVSPKGASGVMQLMESTAKGLKVDRNDTEQNIRGGISLLRELIDNPKIGNDPYKVLAGYNASTETRNNFYQSGNLADLKDETIIHMNKVAEHFGGDLPNASFVEASSTTEPAVNAPEAAASAENYNPYSGTPVSSFADEETLLGTPAETGSMLGAVGLGAGALKWPAWALGKKVLGNFGNKNLSPEDMLKVAEIVTQKNAANRPISFAGDDAGRMGAGQTGNMPYNYAKSAGLTDIEAGQAVDMTKNQGGVHDLASKRAENLQRVNQMAPGFVENPNYGGLMTYSGSAGSGPRESVRITPEGEVSIPKPQAINATPPQAKKPNIGSRIMGSVAGSPPVMGGLAAYGAGYNAQDAYNRANQSDYLGATKSGLGAVASGATLIPKAAPIAGTAAAVIDAERRLQNKDYVGGGTSLLGAVAPYAAPFMFGPQVGIPVGVATAVGAPFINEMRDYLMKPRSTEEQPVQAQPTAQSNQPFNVTTAQKILLSPAQIYMKKLFAERKARGID